MIYLILYFISGFVTIYAENADLPRMVMYVSKVMLMPLLALYLYHHTKSLKEYRLIYLALFFSWWGDIFLMFPRDKESPNAELLFIGGLVSFLIGHVNYIIHFLREVKQKKSATIVVQNPMYVIPFLIYIAIFLGVLFPHLQTMKAPVTVYGTVITLMAIAAFNRKLQVNKASYIMVFVGAVLFVFSDSCIAVNVFYQPFEAARVVIMSTYIIAQYLIVRGIIAARD